MGDDQRPDAPPSLEAPSLGKLFGRRKGRTPAADPDTEPTAPADGATAAPAADRAGDATDRPVDWAPVEAAPAQETAPDRADEDSDTTVLPPAAPPSPASPAQTAAATPPAAQSPAPTPASAVPPSGTSPTTPATPAAPEAGTPKASRPTLTVDGRVAAGVTGLVIGLLVVVLTAGSLVACESVRGVSSCGGGPGFLLLVSVMAAMVVLGGVLLRLAQVPDPTSTSFLAVGLLCVLSLLFLVDVLGEWWMVIVIPLLAAAMFLLSHWVTTHVVDSDA